MKIKEVIKRPVNQNIILMMIIVFLCLCFTFRYTHYISYIIEQSSRADFLILKLINFLFGSFIGIYEYIASVLIFIFSVLARIIYSDNKNKIIVYRILMSISFVITGFALLIPIVILSAGGRNLEILIFRQAFYIAFLATAIIGLRNTYSKRILKEEVHKNEK